MRSADARSPPQGGHEKPTKRPGEIDRRLLRLQHFPPDSPDKQRENRRFSGEKNIALAVNPLDRAGGA
jgi:hypothetical protein